MGTTKNQPIIAGDFRVTYQKKSIFGLLSWYKEIKSERSSADIYICDENIGRVFINAVEYIPK